MVAMLSDRELDLLQAGYNEAVAAWYEDCDAWAWCEWAPEEVA